MSRRSTRSYGHGIQRLGHGDYRLHWTVDFHYPTSRLRFPRGFWRDTDEKGARRFSRRWNVPFPVAPEAK